MTHRKTTVHMKRPIAAVLYIVATLALALIAHQSIDTPISPTAPDGTRSQSPNAVDYPNGSADYYTPIQRADASTPPTADLAPGDVYYCPLDELGRAGCAQAVLTPSLRQHARERGRQDINVDPAGWPAANREALIPALDHVEGSTDYRGWLWNRSHLLADSLGGDAVTENLITGTRTQNVGSTQTHGQADGGMAHLERLAREYLDAQPNDACPLTYSAVAHYTGNEMIPRTVTVAALSCDGSLDVSVEVSNTANGWLIDYANSTYERY